MNDGSGNNRINSTAQERRLREARFRDRIINVLVKKAESLKDVADKNTTLKLEESEKGLIKEIVRLYGWDRGLAFGALNLFMLRSYRFVRLKSMIRRRDRASMANEGEGFGGNLTHVANSPFRPHGAPVPPPLSYMSEAQWFKLDKKIRGHQRGFHFPYLFWWFFDISAVSVVTVVGTILFTDIDGLTKKFTSWPLTDGRSEVCDNFCPVLIREVAKIRKEISESENKSKSEVQIDADCLKNPQDAILKSLILLTSNCEKRYVYEKRLRAEREFDDGQPIRIPPPGVPFDLQISEEEIADLVADESDTFFPSF